MCSFFVLFPVWPGQNYSSEETVMGEKAGALNSLGFSVFYNFFGIVVRITGLSPYLYNNNGSN
jgi:hypothetical protein